MIFLFVGSSGLTEASFPRRLATPQLLLSNVWIIVPLVMRGPTTVFSHRGLPPHQFTPMSGAQSGSRGDCPLGPHTTGHAGPHPAVRKVEVTWRAGEAPARPFLGACFHGPPIPLPRAGRLPGLHPEARRVAPGHWTSVASRYRDPWACCPPFRSALRGDRGIRGSGGPFPALFAATTASADFSLRPASPPAVALSGTRRDLPR